MVEVDLPRVPCLEAAEAGEVHQLVVVVEEEEEEEQEAVAAAAAAEEEEEEEAAAVAAAEQEEQEEQQEARPPQAVQPLLPGLVQFLSCPWQRLQLLAAGSSFQQHLSVLAQSCVSPRP